MDYWELYLAYIRHCEEFNKRNDIDPHHYEMEWNHFLPRCIFGNQPIGQWLTLRQHAIASALQTLAWKKRCHCGMHKEHMPGVLWELCFPYYSDSARKMQLERSKNGEHAWQKPEYVELAKERMEKMWESEEFRERHSQRMSKQNSEKAERGEHPMQQERNRQKQSERTKELWESEEWRENNKDIIAHRTETLVQQNAIRLKSGTHNLMGREAGKRSSEMQLRRVQNGDHQWKTKEHSERVSERMKGAKFWVNPQGTVKRQKEKPEGQWQNGRKWKEQ
jgi:hypothetical protein